MPEILCRHFNGYKPCGLNTKCDSSCAHRSVPEHRLLIVHLGAIGAVVRSTALLAPIRRKYPNAHITWVTEKPSDQLLRSHPEVDRVLTTERSDLLALSCLEFDAVFCVDKSLVAGGVLKATKFKKLFGFRVETVSGAIVPATDAAGPLWELGLSDQKKFFENKKSEIQLATEALELEYRRDPYHLPLTSAEETLAAARRAEWLRDHLAHHDDKLNVHDHNLSPHQPNRSTSPSTKIVRKALPFIVGLNTGCSPVIPYKKLTVETHRQLIPHLEALGLRVVLLGGPEDTARNAEIARDHNVISSPTDKGLRDGLASVAACDLIITGDSLGMHMAISQKKWTVAWFGPTCAHEIDLFDRGVHIHAQVPCSPCWKRSCQKSPMCYDRVEINAIIEGVQKGIQWLMLSSIPPLSATSFSLSPSCESSSDSIPPNP